MPRRPARAPRHRRNLLRPCRFNESSPYHPLRERFDASFGNFARPEDVSQDPRMVATAIYDAVHDATPKLRYLVGSDAQLIGAVRRQTDFEGFEAAMRQS